MVRGPTALAAALGTLLALIIPALPPAAAGTAQSAIVSDNPANWTPNVLDGKVEALVQVGDRIIAGGIFTQVQAAGGTGPILARTNMFAFDATTGAIDTTFAPLFDDEVTAIAVDPPAVPGGDPSLLVGGAFSNINGATARSIGKINAVTGAKDATYRGGANGRVNDLAFSNGRLIIGGQFTTVKTVARNGIASLNPDTGDVTSAIANSFAGIHNPTARGGAQKSAITKFAVDPAGNKLVAIGNFTTVDGVARDQVAMLDISTSPSTLANWYTTQYTSKCSNTFTTYMRDLDISPDGSYVVISTTGAFGGNTSGCDVISRYEMGAVGTNLQSTWRDYTGGDTTYAVEITGTAVYVGGHFRWMNNGFAGDAAGPGAVPREGLAALDPANGLPLSWNPGRERGVGVFDILATDQGVWIGDDTDRVANELRQKLAFFPLAGGTPAPSNTTGTLPTDVYLLGGNDPSVLYRVNAGGPELASVDDGPNWLADSTTSPSPLHTTGGTATTFTTNATLDATVPNTAVDKVPVALFNATRTDPTGGNDMLWSIPEATGLPLTVRLYFANRSGSRTFNVAIDGVSKLANFTPPTSGTMRSFDITSDGTVNINFTRISGDPLISGIEILNRDLTAGGAAAAAQVRSQAFDGSALSGGLTTTPGTEQWGLARGAFAVDGTLFTGFADGTFTRRSFDGISYGTPSIIDLTGGSFAADLPNITGLVFDPRLGRIYFTLANDANLYYRYFTPQSGVVGGIRSTATGDIALLAPQRAAGLLLSGSDLFIADKTDGHLYKLALANNVVTGPATLVNSGIDWRSRGIFVRSGLLPNVAPTAVAAVTGCDLNVCDLDGSGSTDSDGTISSYSWDFGDGSSGTGIAPEHEYPGQGTFTATLTVTDNRGGVDTADVDVTPSDAANQVPTAEFTTSCLNRTCTMDASGSTDPDGTIASYTWDFGDGSSGTGANPTHAYGTAGTDTISLVVTDDDDADSAAVTSDVAPTDPPDSSIGFRGSATSTSNSPTQRVTEPATVAAGDALLLFSTSNTATSVTTPPAGWTLLGSRLSSTDTQTLLYGRVATAADAASQPTILYSATTKAVVTLLAYSGTAPDPFQTVASAAETVNRATHSTPVVTLPVESSWVVSYWADKSSATTAWGLPVTQISRGAIASTGAGHVTSASSDLGEALPAGTSGGLTATADSSSAKATTWSVVLKAANAPNQAPTAAFTSTCNHLTCTLNGSTSSDPDGSVASYAWDFGDGDTDTVSGNIAMHPFTADGTHTISLTVTDNQGLASTAVTHDVVLTAAPAVAFRASATFSGNAVTNKVTIPASVQSGDAMLLFVTTNSTAGVTTPPAGWTAAGSQTVSTDTRTLLYSKVATATDASKVQSITFAAVTKADLTLLAYSGVADDPFESVTSAAETVNRSAHTTPDTTVITPNSWVVSYWADKSSATTSWSDPPLQVRRSTSAGTGAGRITSLATDSGSGSAAGASPGLTATADSASAKATMWSVVIKAQS